MAIFQINDRSFDFVLPEGVRPEEVEIEYSPFQPASWSNTQHSYDLGCRVTQLAAGVYLRHKYDHSNVPGTFVDDDGYQYQEWGYLEEDEYAIVITEPETVGLTLEGFTPEEQAQYRLAQLVRQETGKRMTTEWRIHLVAELPVIVDRSISTPANTSNVTWGGK